MRLKSILFFCLTLSFPKLFAQMPGELLSNTDFDYGYTNSPNHQIEMVDLDSDNILDPVIINQYRNNSTGTQSYIAIHFKNGTIWDTIQPFTTVGSFGIQYCYNGILAEKFLAHSSNYLSIIDPTNWQYNTYQSNLVGINSVVYVPDGTMYATKTTGTEIYKSIDNGITFTEYTTIGDGDPAVNLSFGGLPILKSSKNGQYISFVGTYEDGAVNGGYDIVYFYKSTDFGATWHGKTIGIDGVYGQVVNRNYAPLFENFGQLSFEVDTLGVTHVVMNGFGNGVLPGSADTTEVFPVLYWNSRDEDWIAITDESIEYPSDGFGNVRSDLRAGNGIGNAYPSIAITPDGNGVAVIYQAIEFWGGIGSTYNIYPGDGGSNSIPIAYTTLYVNISDNGGQSWYFQFYPLGGFDNSKVEQFPICAPHIEDLGFPFLFKVHYIYQYDEIPGVSIFNQNSISENGGWYYHNYLHLGTDVSDENTVITDFRLFQNYPNPFNPSTTIKFALPVKTNLSLNVYNTLGEKVAEIFKGEMEEGYHEIVFNASGLSSGIYFYKIESENFNLTKKMILMK